MVRDAQNASPSDGYVAPFPATAAPNGAPSSPGFVPEWLADEWAKLCDHCPAGVDPDRWRLAISDAERFFRTWGYACEWFDNGPPPQFTAEQLFAVPSNGGARGLFWRLRGREVEDLGCECVYLPGGEMVHLDETAAVAEGHGDGRR
jgi:hypothetical protein